MKQTMSQLSSMEAMFKALADQTRLRILGLLSAGEVCVCEIHESLQIPQPTASRHLAYLKRAGLVADRREGQWVHYRLVAPEDGVLESVLGAATHALSHLPTTRTDRERLCCTTGRDLPANESAPRLTCC